MALIDLEQYGIRVGTIYDESSPGTVEEQLLAFIDDASALVIQIAALETAWTDATVPDVVVPVLVNMVRRARENPRGLTGEQLGDYQWQAAGANQTAIYATREERRIIRRAAGTLSVGSVQLEGYLPTSGLGVLDEDDLLGGL